MFTLITYKQIILNTVLIINDLDMRSETSFDAQAYKIPRPRRSYLNAICSLKVPMDVQALIYQLHNVYDPSRPN